MTAGVNDASLFMAFCHAVKGVLAVVSHANVRQHPAMTIGARIRAARRQQNMTQQQLADALGVDASTVTKWETDPNRRPSRDAMPDIARVLHRSIDWIEGRGGVSDSGRDWGPPRPAAAKPRSGDADLDPALLTQVLKMSMESLLQRYGVEVPERQFEDAAAAAASAYAAYFRLRSEEDDAA